MTLQFLNHQGDVLVSFDSGRRGVVERTGFVTSFRDGARRGTVGHSSLPAGPWGVPSSAPHMLIQNQNLQEGQIVTLAPGLVWTDASEEETWKRALAHLEANGADLPALLGRAAAACAAAVPGECTWDPEAAWEEDEV